MLTKRETVQEWRDEESAPSRLPFYISNGGFYGARAVRDFDERRERETRDGVEDENMQGEGRGKGQEDLSNC